MVGSSLVVMQCSGMAEVPAEINSDIVQSSLKIYWIRRCQSLVNTKHWQLLFCFLVHLCEIRVDSVGRGRIMLAPSLLVSSTCAAAYCRRC